MMKNWFTKFLLNRDTFGQPVQVAYKGRETYNTILGGILTLLMQGMTLAYIFTSSLELVLMEDP